MSCTPKGLARLASNYLIDHEAELHTRGEHFNHEAFEALRKDLTLELARAIVDCWIEWRDEQNDRPYTEKGGP